MNRTFARSLMVASLALFVAMIAGAHSAPSAAQGNATPAATFTLAGTPEVTVPDQGPAFETDVIKGQVDEKGTYELNILKLRTDALPAQTGDAFNAAMDDLVNTQIQDFAQQHADAIKAVPDSMSSLKIEFKRFLWTNDVVSLRYSISFYYAGAAHPGFYSISMNYDLKNGKFLTLADLFTPDAKYLDVISGYATAELKTQGRLTFPEGAQPKEENYQNWNLTDAALNLMFDPYQVGSWAEGPTEILMPYGALKAIVNPAGPIASFVK